MGGLCASLSTLAISMNETCDGAGGADLQSAVSVSSRHLPILPLLLPGAGWLCGATVPALEAPARHLEAEHGTESRLSREQLQCVSRLRPGRIAQWAVSRSRGAESEDTERWLSTQSRRHRRQCEQGGVMMPSRHGCCAGSGGWNLIKVPPAQQCYCCSD